jgi:hypothetical protein
MKVSLSRERVSLEREAILLREVAQLGEPLFCLCPPHPRHLNDIGYRVQGRGCGRGFRVSG